MDELSKQTIVNLHSEVQTLKARIREVEDSRIDILEENIRLVLKLEEFESELEQLREKVRRFEKESIDLKHPN